MNTPEEPNPFRSPDAVESFPQSKPFLSFWGVLCLAGSVAIALLPFLPGISILLAIGLAPAFVHAYVRLVRHARDTGMPEPMRQLGIMLGSLVIVLVIALAAVIVGGLFCFSTLAAFSWSSAGDQVVIPFAFVFGIVIPFGIYWVLFAGSLGYFRKANSPQSLENSHEKEAD